jgi:hypothetical protein
VDFACAEIVFVSIPSQQFSTKDFQVEAIPGPPIPPADPVDLLVEKLNPFATVDRPVGRTPRPAQFSISSDFFESWQKNYPALSERLPGWESGDDAIKRQGFS